MVVHSQGALFTTGAVGGTLDLQSSALGAIRFKGVACKGRHTSISGTHLVQIRQSLLQSRACSNKERNSEWSGVFWQHCEQEDACGLSRTDSEFQKHEKRDKQVFVQKGVQEKPQRSARFLCKLYAAGALAAL